MKNDRLFQLLYLLLEKGSATAPELAETLGVSVRTVYRDVEALSVAGVPVYALPGRGGGIALMPGYALNKALLTDAEQNRLLYALQSLHAADGQMDTLLAKLGGVFQKQSVNWIQVDFSRWGFGKMDNRRFELLRNAILDRRMLVLLYCGSNGKTTERTVKPFRLVFKDKNWYLQAFCTLAKDYRLFKINRIVKLTPTHETFTDVFKDAPPVETDDMMTMGEHYKVKLLFSPAVAYRVYDDFGHANIETRPDGMLAVATYFPENDWAVEYLLSFGDGVTVLSPPELRERVRDSARKIYEHHQT